MLRAPRSRSGIPRGRQALASSSARERVSSELEPPGPAAEATNPHTLQSARRHRPRRAKRRNVECSTASPACPFPRRGAGPGPLAETARRATPCGAGATTNMCNTLGNRRIAAQPHGSAPVRPSRMETRPRGPPHCRFAEAVDRCPAGHRAGSHDGLRPHPVFGRMGKGTSGASPECRGSLVPMNQGGPHGSEEPRRRKAPRRDPKTSPYEPDCRMMRSETWC